MLTRGVDGCCSVQTAIRLCRLQERRPNDASGKYRDHTNDCGPNQGPMAHRDFILLSRQSE
jgi:hypothetical protein